MLRLEEMPDDNALLADVAVEFPRLDPDTAESCPEQMSQLLDYLAREVPGGSSLTSSDLHFERTALVGGSAYWIWRFREPGVDGAEAFATVQLADQGLVVGYETNYFGLSPEQFMLGDYHQVF